MPSPRKRFDMPELLSEPAPAAPAPLPDSAPARSFRWPRAIIGAVLLGLVAAVIFLREPTSPLTAEGIEEARRLWRAAHAENYDLNLVVRTGDATPSLYEVRVRNGRVIQLHRNGLPADSNRPNDFSVPGLLDTLEREFKLALDPAGPFSASSGRVLMRVRFNQKLGYPERYLRSAAGSRSNMEIQVRSFRAVEPE